MQWFCFGAIEKMIIFKISANFLGNVSFFWSRSWVTWNYHSYIQVTNDLRFDGFDYTGALDGMSWKNHLAVMENATMLCPLFCGNCLEKRISRKETSPDVPAWYVALWNALLVSWWPMESGFGGFLHLVPTQTVVLFWFFLVRRWQDLGDRSSNSCKPPAKQRKTSGFPTIFYLNPQSSQIKKVQEAWHHICDRKGRMTSPINID